MITGDIQAGRETVHRVLSACASSVKRVESGRWTVALCNGSMLRASAVIDDEDWFVIKAKVRTVRKRSAAVLEKLWEVLTWNAEVGGLAKFVFAPSKGVLSVRADIPLDDTDGFPEEQIRRACEDISGAYAHFRGGGEKTRRTDDGSLQQEAPSAEDDLEALCLQTGWPFARRGSDTFSVPLDRHGSWHAMVSRRKGPPDAERGPRGSRRGRGAAVSADVGTCESPSVPSRRALGLLLLSASGVVRMARGAASTRDDRTTLRFEVVLEPCADAGQLVHALTALHVVCCQLCGREAQALLADEGIAREYLSARGWSP